MKVRMVGAALLAAMTFPFTATPASAHGACYAIGAWAPEQGIRQLTGGGSIACSTGHVHFEIEICFQWAPVDQTGIYFTQSCQTTVVDDGTAYGTVGTVGFQYCPYLTGNWRTRVSAVVDSHVVDATHSPPALIVSNCGL